MPESRRVRPQSACTGAEIELSMTSQPLSNSPTPRQLSRTAHSTPAGQRALLLALGTAAFMVSLDGRVVAPLLPTIADDFAISIADASWLVSGYMLPYGFCQLAYGPAADRWGKVRVAAYAMAAFSVGTALCGAFPSFASIVLLRALTGAAAAGLIPLTIAYIGDTMPYEERQGALAMLMASTGAAQALSTSAGGTIAAFVSWRTVFPILGGLAAAATLALFSFRHRELRVAFEAGTPRLRYRDALSAPLLRPLLVLVSVEGFLYMGGFSFLSGLMEERFGLDAFDIGLVLGVAGLAQLGSARLLPRMVLRFGETTLLSVGGILMAGAYLLSAVAGSVPLIVLACALLGAGFMMCHSTLQTRATEAFPRGRGTALALFAFSLFSGSALGTACFGYASAALGYAYTFAAGGLLLLGFTAVVVRVRA